MGRKYGSRSRKDLQGKTNKAVYMYCHVRVPEVLSFTVLLLFLYIKHHSGHAVTISLFEIHINLTANQSNLALV